MCWVNPTQVLHLVMAALSAMLLSPFFWQVQKPSALRGHYSCLLTSQTELWLKHRGSLFMCCRQPVHSRAHGLPSQIWCTTLYESQWEGVTLTLKIQVLSPCNSTFFSTWYQGTRPSLAQSRTRWASNTGPLLSRIQKDYADSTDHRTFSYSFLVVLLLFWGFMVKHHKTSGLFQMCSCFQGVKLFYCEETEELSVQS